MVRSVSFLGQFFLIPKSGRQVSLRSFGLPSNTAHMIPIQGLEFPIRDNEGRKQKY